MSTPARGDAGSQLSPSPDVPAPPTAVAAVFEGLPPPVRRRLLEVRALIFRVASENPEIGPLSETLKWGEPAYLTEATRSGTTVRLGRVGGSEDQCAVLVNCRTSLIDEFRSCFPDEFRFAGSRALLLDTEAALPVEPLAACLYRALTYHRRKPASRRQ